jgi:YidC/Oxa1 family membrane protein insertase
VEKRFLLFLIATMLTLYIFTRINLWLNPPVPRMPKDAPVAPAVAKPAEQPPPVLDTPKEPTAELAISQDAQDPSTKASDRWLSIGSADPASPYRMLVTLSSRGASIERIELNDPRFLDIEDMSGYLGHLALTDFGDGPGCVVNVVGHGTPAALAVPKKGGAAGLRPRDVIRAHDGQPIKDCVDFDRFMKESRPGQSVVLSIQRDGVDQEFEVVLGRHPLELIRPEISVAGGQKTAHPLSFLMALSRIENRSVKFGQDELNGFPSTFNENWEVVAVDKATEPTVEFRYTLGSDVMQKLDLNSPVQLVKRYRLAKVSDEEHSDRDARAYHLKLEIEIRNLGDQRVDVAYRLDGPTGLPTEGWWYATKVHPSRFGGAGIRDVVAKGFHTGHKMFTNPKIVQKAETNADSPDTPMFEEGITSVEYVGVDAQYFASALLADLPEDATEQQEGRYRFESAVARVVGPVDKERLAKTDVSFRVDSPLIRIDGGSQFKQSFLIFAGPKRSSLLAEYGLQECISYGWFRQFAIPLTYVLHFFYGIFRNYGIAIILLTVLVRGCLFPLGRQQALNAQKMQELAPEMKRIADKYKDDMQKRAEAQRELFRKNNYNPLAGCLPLFLQLPIFVGLYRALSVDIELRQAALIPGLRWCSNLAGPDQLFYWEPFMPAFLGGHTGILGPYFNLLPLVSIALMIMQQKMFAPPPQDEQQALQFKLMQYMMVIVGFMFFKVPAGLCIYFIASSLWGLAERKLLPKPKPKDGTAPPVEKERRSIMSSIMSLASKPATNGAARKEERKRLRQKRK